MRWLPILLFLTACAQAPRMVKDDYGQCHVIDGQRITWNVPCNFWKVYEW